MEMPKDFDLYEPSDINRNFTRGIKKEYIKSLHIDDQDFGDSFIYTQFFQSNLENIITNIQQIQKK